MCTMYTCILLLLTLVAASTVVSHTTCVESQPCVFQYSGYYVDLTSVPTLSSVDIPFPQYLYSYSPCKPFRCDLSSATGDSLACRLVVQSITNQNLISNGTRPECSQDIHKIQHLKYRNGQTTLDVKLKCITNEPSTLKIENNNGKHYIFELSSPHACVKTNPTQTTETTIRTHAPNVTTQGTTSEVTPSPSTHNVTTQSTTSEVTTSPSTHNVTTQSTTSEVTTSPSTHNVTTQSTTSEVTTSPSTRNTNTTHPNTSNTTQPNTHTTAHDTHSTGHSTGGTTQMTHSTSPGGSGTVVLSPMLLLALPTLLLWNHGIF